MNERILLDLGAPIADALDLPRRVPVRRDALSELRGTDGLDLAVLARELTAAAADDPAIARSLGHGLARLDLLLAAPTSPATPPPTTPAPTTGPQTVAPTPPTEHRRRAPAVLIVVLLVAIGGAAYVFLTQEDEPTATEAAPTTSVSVTPPSPSTTEATVSTTSTTTSTTSTTTTTTTTTIPTLSLPAVVGERRGATVDSLEALGLLVEVERVDSYDADAGVILSVEPPEGSELVAGDTVSLTVARRPSECNDRPGTTPPTAFADIGDLGDEATDAIAWAVAVGLVTDDSTFGPNDPMSRAAAVTVLHRYMCEPLAQGLPVSFTDVAAGAFYAEAVAWAAASGTVTGTSTTTFSPDDPITRAAFMTVVWRALGEPRSDADLPFTDVPSGAFYEDALRWAFGEGLINGTTPTTFSPDAALDRNTTIVLFSRIELGPNPLVG